jgi:hypothetical protein
VFIWVKRELVAIKSFGEKECFPFKEGDTRRDVVCVDLKREEWRGRKPMFLQLWKKCAMADWGRGGGGN